MTLPVMDGHDEDADAEKPHPENPRRCRPCDAGRHDECRVRYAGGPKCACECREAARTKKHDWLDERFNDEIELEQAMGHAPPMRLVTQASMAGAITPTAKDAGWVFVGRFKTSAQRPSTADGRWSLDCRRCGPPRKLPTSRFVVPALEPRPLTWLRDGRAMSEATTEHVYRVGRCQACQTIFWFELLVKK